MLIGGEKRPMKIVSLLPSATEIICALGLADQLVAVTHECDYPTYVTQKPFITRSLLPSDLTSGQIDQAVQGQLAADAHSLYHIDRDLLTKLAPDLIVTQQLCEVCAVAYDEVVEAVRGLPHPPEVLNLEPMSLGDVLSDIRRVGEATGHGREALQLVSSLENRITQVRREALKMKYRPQVAFLEWIDPLFCGGHWNPELVELAGGVDPLGRRGLPSIRLDWEQVRAMHPEVMVISCCGFSASRAKEDLPLLKALPGWEDLPCVREGRVHVVDGKSYFSRPGPRLVDSLELLASLLRPVSIG
jgi:iron complex transport system substrate-binding protein